MYRHLSRYAITAAPPAAAAAATVVVCGQAAPAGGRHHFTTATTAPLVDTHVDASDNTKKTNDSSLNSLSAVTSSVSASSTAANNNVVRSSRRGHHESIVLNNSCNGSNSSTLSGAGAAAAAAPNPLARWSVGMRWWRPIHSAQQQQQHHFGGGKGEGPPYSPSPSSTNTLPSSLLVPLVLPVSVAMSGCNKAFNATNAVRTTRYFGAALPPQFLGARSAADIASLTSTNISNSTNTSSGPPDTNDDSSGSVSTSCSNSSAPPPPPPDTMRFGPDWPPRPHQPSNDEDALTRHETSTLTTRLCADGGDSRGSTHISSSENHNRSNGWRVIALENYAGISRNMHHVRLAPPAVSATAATGGSSDRSVNGGGHCSASVAASDSSVRPTPTTPTRCTTSGTPFRGLGVLMGDENKGVALDRLRAADAVVFIPQYGTISSLNVVTTLGLALFYAWMDMVCPAHRLLSLASAQPPPPPPPTDTLEPVAASPATTSASTSSPAMATLSATTVTDSGTDSTSSGSRSASGSPLGAYMASFAAPLPTMALDPPAQLSATTPPPPLTSMAAGDLPTEALPLSVRSEHAGRDHLHARGAAPAEPWNNIAPDAERVDARPIHPAFYNLADEAIGTAHGQIRAALAEHVARATGLLPTTTAQKDSHEDGKKAPLMEGVVAARAVEAAVAQGHWLLERRIPRVLYENDFDQRNFGGLIRNANAFLCPRVYYVGRRKINVKGAVGCTHYSPPCFLGRLPASAAACGGGSEAEAEAVTAATMAAVQAMLLEDGGRALWLLSCDQDFLYTTAPDASDAAAASNGAIAGSASSGLPSAAPCAAPGMTTGGSRRYDHCYSSEASLRAYEALQSRCTAAGLDLSLTDSEATIAAAMTATAGGVVLLVPQEGKLPHPQLLALCTRIVRILPPNPILLTTAPPPPLEGTTLSATTATTTTNTSSSSTTTATAYLSGGAAEDCRGLPSQVASGIALHRLMTCALPALKF